eukprot:351882-Chlamydomonas_euryale.AAC.19
MVAMTLAEIGCGGGVRGNECENSWEGWEGSQEVLAGALPLGGSPRARRCLSRRAPIRCRRTQLRAGPSHRRRPRRHGSRYRADGMLPWNAGGVPGAGRANECMTMREGVRQLDTPRPTPSTPLSTGAHRPCIARRIWAASAFGPTCVPDASSCCTEPPAWVMWMLVVDCSV